MQAESVSLKAQVGLADPLVISKNHGLISKGEMKEKNHHLLPLSECSYVTLTQGGSLGR